MSKDIIAEAKRFTRLNSTESKTRKHLSNVLGQLQKRQDVIDAAETFINGWACPEDQGDQFDYDWLHLDKALEKLNK